jgi:hypothetical protein
VAKTIAGELPLLETIFSTTDAYELRFVTNHPKHTNFATHPLIALVQMAKLF